MTDKDQKNLNPVVVAIAGIALGAAGATALVLSDQETRKLASKKAREVTKHLKKLSIQTLQQMHSEIGNDKVVESPLNGVVHSNQSSEIKKIEVTKP